MGSGAGKCVGKLIYTGSGDRFIKVQKNGTKLIITDSSAGKTGKIQFTGNYNGVFYGIVTYGTSTLQMDAGTIFFKNGYAGKYARGVTMVGTSTFIMTGGTVQAESPSQTRGINATDADTSPTIRISGGKVIAKTYSAISGSDTTWTENAIGVYSTRASVEVTGNPTITADASNSSTGIYLSGIATSDIRGGTIIGTAHTTTDGYGIQYSGTTNNQISGGTIKGICGTTQTEALRIDASSRVDVSNGTFYSCANSGQSHCVFVRNSTLNITGGSFTATATTSSAGNVEAVRLYSGAVCTINGGTFTATGTSNSMAMRVLYDGTATINDGTFTSSIRTISLADAGIANSGTARVTINGGTFIANNQFVLYAASTGDGTTGVITVNGGYFFTTGHNQIANKAGTGSVVLYGGKYNENSGTNHKTNLNSYKSGTTTLTDISETQGGKTYVYKLATPSHHAANVKTSSNEANFEELDDAWTYAMAQQNATITLLSDGTSELYPDSGELPPHAGPQ